MRGRTAQRRMRRRADVPGFRPGSGVLRRAAVVGILSLDPDQQEGVHHLAQADPRDPTLENYVEVLYSAQFSVFLINSLELSVAGSVGAILVAAPRSPPFSAWTSAVTLRC